MSAKEKAYPFDRIEPKWQNYWMKHKTFRAADPGESGSEKPKYYVLDMFPYPSASGLHVGHLEGYTATDIIARYKRMKGFHVLHPMGWDAFGLPAEQYAIETKTHPKIVTKRNVDNFRRQIQSIGFSYDWDREVDTTDPNYYRWTQWIFLKLFEKGLAYEAEIPVNWCPALGTVLANEEVIDGKSERGGHPVIRKPMRQWVLKITAYADRLLEDLKELDWPESIKEMQRNWIGRSIGAEVDFPVCHSERSEESHSGSFAVQSAAQDDKESCKIRVFTTRPDTLFGATYMVLSPEHPLVSRIVVPGRQSEVSHYQEESSRKSDLQRTDLAKEKSGVFTGAYAVNPVNGQKIPIWIADYVLMGYGTGAIMAVPAHDERDFEFAKKYKLPIIPVIKPLDVGAGLPRPDKQGEETSPLQHSRDLHEINRAFTGVGTVINSKTPDGSFTINGLKSDEAIKKITDWIEAKGLGKKSIQYKLRDWLFSRQRYWGEPIPIIHCPKCGLVTLKEKDLPLELPYTEDFVPHVFIPSTTEGKLGSGIATTSDVVHEFRVPLDHVKINGELWRKTQCPNCGNLAYRETNTMPQWAGSCWYYLRFIDPHNDKKLIDPEKEKYWMKVDLYIGGAEHAVLHLLYSRFWHKVLYDFGLVSTQEPFQRLVNQGMILGEDNQKMSKSRGNVINPDDLITEYGADSIRLYEMFMGPLEMGKPWSTKGLEGVHRFLGRVWRLFLDRDGKPHSNIKKREASKEELKLLHKTIKKVTEDLEGLRFNTAISALMIFVNEEMSRKIHARDVLNKFILLLAPFAPHIAEELWEYLGVQKTLAYETWPRYDETFLVEDEVEIGIQILGKLRSRIKVPKGTSENELKERVLRDEIVKKWIDGKPVQKIIVVPDRLINIIL